jgi:methyl-accepting chemotaxis protein
VVDRPDNVYRRPVPRKVSPKHKVVAGIGSIVALLLAAVTLSVFLVRDLSAEQAQLTGRSLPFSAAVAAASLSATEAANHERGFLITGDPAFAGRFWASKRRACGYLGDARRSAEGAEQRRAIGEARAGFERWAASVRREFAAFRSGDRSAAVAASFGPHRSLRLRYERRLAGASKLGSSAVLRSTRSVETTSAHSVTILVVLLVLTTVAAVAVGVWLVRTILQPMESLLELLGSRRRS